MPFIFQMDFQFQRLILSLINQRLPFRYFDFVLFVPFVVKIFSHIPWSKKHVLSSHLLVGYKFSK